MKILIIRGENLASLQAPFEIDFEKEPLASAGLYAISGPTGAGKSSLLDAICLALYQTTPRLHAAPSNQVKVPDVKNKFISASDPSSLMRRGVGYCWVEVEFEGSDRQRYLARWSVNRAHNSPEGALQDPKVELRNLSKKVLITDAKSQITSAIVSAVGLTFEEFTRSVLLAQNEFTSFLKASDNKRAEILEKLTGIDIFARIGARVYRIADQFTKELKALDLQRKEISFLNDAQLAEKKEELSAVTERLQRLASLDTQLQTLATVRSSWQKSDATCRESELIYKNASQKTPTLKNELNQKQNAQTAAREAQAQAEPKIAEANLLEGERNALKNQRQPLITLATTLEDALKAAHIEKSNKEEALIKAQQTQSKIQNWQERHFHLKIWSEDWVKYNAQFESSIKLFEELRAARQSQAGEEVNAQKWADKIEESQKREALAEKKVEELARRLEQESNQMQTLGDFMSLSQCNLNLERKKMSLCQSLDLAKSAGQSESDIRLIEKDIAHSEEEIGRMDGELLSARESEQHAEFLWSQAREDEQIAERNASANVSGLRTQLKSGQACPVCGSTEHPLALQSETASLELSLSSARQKSLEQKKQTESARQRVNELQNALTRLHTHLEHSKTKLLEADKNLNKIRLDLENLNVAWPIAATFQDETQKTIAGLEIEILETHQKITAGQQLNASIEKLRKETIDAERALTAQRAATVESQAQRQIVLERLKDLATAIEQKDRELTTTLDLLSYPHQNKPDWRSHWQQNPTGYAKEISEAVARWNDGQIAAQRTANDIAQLQTQLAAASQAFTEKEQQFKKNAADLNEIESKIKQISQQMDGLLNGVSLNEFSSALRQAVQSAENEYGQALEHFNDHEKDLHRLQGLMQQNHEALNNAKNLWLTQFETCQNIGSKCGFYLSEENASEILKNLLVEIERLRAREVQIHTDLNVNLNNLRMREDLTQRIEEKERVALNWAKLSELIGSADGDKFRKEAHRLTLKVLFAHANYHLQSFARRYRLFIPPEGAQGILVQDLDIGGELRSVYSLSGGESFLVSLALAMGLASLSSHQIPVESLFIDEGFGSLDSETLKVAMDALDRLQAQGRKVGVISHVPDMADRIGVQIRVKPDGEGRSRIFIPGKGV